MTTPKKYRWNSPQEWLLEQAELWPADMLLSVVQDLVSKLDGDAIQDIFQAEMDKDGYFTPINDDGE